MADEERFLEEIAPFLDAVDEPLTELWSLAVEQSDSCAVANAPTHSLSPTAWTRRRRRSAKRSRSTTCEDIESELAQLRTQRTALQQRLATLRRPLQLPAPEDSLFGATWEQIAKRRCEERVRAEAENVRLKKQLELQAVVARNLQQSMRQLAAGDDSWGEPTASNHPSKEIPMHHRVVVSAEDVPIYDMLIGEIDAAYFRLDQVFAENGLCDWQLDASNPSTSHARLKTRRSKAAAKDSLYIELINTDVVPYDMDLAYQLSWYCWELLYFAKNCVAYDQQAANVIAYKTRAEISLNGERVVLEYLNATKWYREADRICCVWRSISRVDSHFPGMFVDEVGWQVLRPLGDDPGGGTAMLTSTQLECKRVGGGSPVSLEEIRASQLVNLAVSAFEADLLEVNSMMLNMFVQDPSSSAPVLAESDAVSVVNPR